MPQREIHFPFPVKGLDTHWGHSVQPLPCSPDMLNVRPYDVLGQRMRGGQRPGLRKLYTDELGSGNPIRLLAQVTTTKDTSSYTGVDEDLFNRPTALTLGDDWSQASWSSDNIGIRDYKASQSPLPAFRAVVRKALTLSAANTYSVQITLKPNDIGYIGSYRYIYLRMNASTPAITTDGTEVRLTWTWTGSTYNVTPRVRSYVASSMTLDETGTTFQTGERWSNHIFKCTVLGNALTVYVDGVSRHTSTLPAQAGFRVGFGAQGGGTQRCYEDSWLVTGVYVAGEPTPRKTMLIASANQTVYEEVTEGALTEVTGGGAEDLAPDHSIMAAEAAEKLYIADYGGTKVSGTDGTISGASNNLLDAASVADWTAHSIDADTDVVVIYGATGPTEGTYAISSIAAGNLTLDANLSAGGTCSYRIERAPKVYEYGVGVDIFLANLGDVPTGCRVVTLWRNRLVWANDHNSPQSWYMSRQGDYDDYDYTQTDAQAAVAGSTADAGEVAEPVTALIPFTDDYLIFGCTSSLWILRGDPMEGGRIDNVSYKTGVIDKLAWCASPDGTIYFLGNSGFYKMRPGGMPQNLSIGRLPRELVGINTETHEVFCAWDWRRYGVLIFISTKSAGTSTHYFYDARADGFFPEQLPSDLGPTMVLDYNASSPSYRHALVGGRDGYIRIYDPDEKNDDGTAIDSYVVLAPQRLSRDELVDGLLNRLDATLADGTDSLDWELRVADTAEEAVGAMALATGTWGGDLRRPAIRRRVRGGYLAIKLQNDTASETWAMEVLVGIARPAGKVRI